MLISHLPPERHGRGIRFHYSSPPHTVGIGANARYNANPPESALHRRRSLVKPPLIPSCVMWPVHRLSRLTFTTIWPKMRHLMAHRTLANTPPPGLGNAKPVNFGSKHIKIVRPTDHCCRGSEHTIWLGPLECIGGGGGSRCTRAPLL